MIVKIENSSYAYADGNVTFHATCRLLADDSMTILHEKGISACATLQSSDWHVAIRQTCIEQARSIRDTYIAMLQAAMAAYPTAASPEGILAMLTMEIEGGI